MIAQGGMGCGVRAERDDGVFAQAVAIKLIRSDRQFRHCWSDSPKSAAFRRGCTTQRSCGFSTAGKSRVGHG